MSFSKNAVICLTKAKTASKGYHESCELENAGSDSFCRCNYVPEEESRKWHRRQQQAKQ